MGKGGMEIDSFNKDGEVKGSPHVLFIHTHIRWARKKSSRNSGCLTGLALWHMELLEFLSQRRKAMKEKGKVRGNRKRETRTWETEREEVGVRLWYTGCRRNNEGIKKITDAVCIYIVHFYDSLPFSPHFFLGHRTLSHIMSLVYLYPSIWLLPL